MAIEIWKPIKGYEGTYEVSNLGHVRSLVRIDRLGRFVPEKIRSIKKNNRGYVQISLYKDGRAKYYLLHRLVAEAFIPNPDNLPQINHKDENKDNNCVENLEWCDNIYNRRYGTGYARSVAKHDYKKIGAGNRRPVVQCDCFGNPIKMWDGVIIAAKTLGVSDSAIRNCCYGRNKTAAGYCWRYT